MCNLHISCRAFAVKKNVQKEHMDRFVDSILAPLARLLVARGISFGDLSERLKHHYLKAAQASAGQQVSDSRLSILTGLQRRDVRRLVETPLPDEPRKPNHQTRLVALWQVDATYAGRDLPRRGEGGFDELALRIRRDIHPRTILNALLDAGTVAIQPDSSIRLLVPSFQPLAGSEGQLDYLADNAGDFLTASAHNVLGLQPAFFERAVHYNQLSAADVAELEQDFRSGQMALLQRLNARAAKMQDTSPGDERFRAGGYFYSETEKS
jgi:hypothetical protein